MINDKFPFVHNTTSDSCYQYLGIRYNSNQAGTRSLQRRLVDGIIQCLKERPDFHLMLEPTLKLLKLKKSFKILYLPKSRSRFFSKDLTVDNLTYLFTHWEETWPKRKTKPFSYDYFHRLSKEEIYETVAFINECRNRISHSGEENCLEYNLFEDKTRSLLAHDGKNLQRLTSLDVLSFPRIQIEKNSVFNLEESSSGEFHFLSTIVGILTSIDNNSLVLIDEPEVSFHPNWQMQYVDQLRQLFHKYKSCHFVLATHSHFMVSDLRKPGSNFSFLKWGEENTLEIKYGGENTYGWSTEDILYNIFTLPTTRNYYLADEIGSILELISAKDQNLNLIKRKVEELSKKKMELKEIDPLNEILDRLFERYK